MVNRLFTDCQQRVSRVGHNLFMDDVWSRIDRELSRRHKNWQWLYTAMGYSKERVNNWSRRGVPAKEYPAIASVLQRSVEWLISGLEDASSPNGPSSPPVSPPSTGWVSSVTKTGRAPVVAWARIGEDVLKDPLEMGGAETLDYVQIGTPGRLTKLITVCDDSLAPRLNIGDMVAIDPDNRSPERGQVALFRSTADGRYFLRRYQPLVPPAFEAVDAKGSALDSTRHGLEIIGVRCGVVLADI